MSELLTDLANERAVIQAIEDNMFSFWMNYGRLQGCEAFEDERLMYFMSGIPHPLLNGVFRAQLTASQIEPTITEILERFATRGLPMFWWTGPQTLPSDLGERLKKHRLIGGDNTPGMAVALDSLPERMPVPDNLQIDAVEDEAALHQWIDVLAVHPATYQLEVNRGITGQLAPRRYIGKLNGEPVAASVLHLDAGVAGIYAVATVEEARGQGIGTAITVRALHDARAAGYQVGILQSSKMGYGIYKRLGFKTFCDLEIFYFQPN